MTYFLLALTLGVMSSLHCVGMCGPIALALPVGKRKGWDKWRYISFYHGGRLVMYALMGAAVGWFGISADWLGLQATSSFSIGVFLALGVILFYSAQYGSFKIFKKGRKWSQQLMAKGLQKKGCTGAILIGLANGLIPCGMVYMAIAASLSTGNSLEAALFMLLFGAGTLPAFSLLSQLSGWVYKNTRFSFHSVMPILVLISAFVLMGRGIYFYKIDKNNSSITVCE